MKIIADASIPHLKDLFANSFILDFYNDEAELRNLLTNHEILICRSTLKITSSLLAGSSIKCIATLSSGIDHIDVNYLQKHNITLFDAKGCNASSVADYVLSVIALLDLQNKIKGKNVGIIGFGHVGKAVNQRLQELNFKTIYYDPYLNSNTTLKDLITCDLLCIHPNLHDNPPYPSRNLINKNFLQELSLQTIIINASRGDIVNETDLLQCQIPIIYCTDVYANEPNIDVNIIDFATICTTHIAGHALEAKVLGLKKLCHDIYQHFNLPVPNLDILKESHVLDTKASKTWQERVLACYNPINETLSFKQAKDKKSAFLELRRQHSRHLYTEMPRS